MISIELIIGSFAVLWASIDPIGTLPVFLAATKGRPRSDKIQIAKLASICAFFILLTFLLLGSVVLKYVGVPLSAFQVSGGIVLFIFALSMIFGDSKPEEEIGLIKNTNEIAIFPLAIPSIAGPGAILSVMLLSDGSRHSIIGQAIVVLILAMILLINYLVMYYSGPVHEKIGNSGEVVISKVMGLILASIAANSVLVGIKAYFNL